MINRRTFSKAVGLGMSAAAVPTVAVAADGSGRPAAVDPAEAPAQARAFGRLKQVRAGVLDIGYAEAGPAHGPAAVCLHGWPYDIHSYVDVAPLLAEAGYRVIVPYLRGHGTTTFRSPTEVRNAQQSAVALDIVALLDALGIRRAVLAGFDWGSRTADIVAALWPERVRALVSVGGYLVTDVRAQQNPLPPKAEHTWWYQYYFATERGRRALENPQYRRELCRAVWAEASPTWAFDDATFERTAAAFDNPDYAAIVTHNYRWRLGLAAGEARYDRYEQRLADRPTIGVPTITLDPGLDPFLASTDGLGYRKLFTGAYEHRVLDGVGHNAPQEAPAAFARAVLDADRL
ncbi:alpha/beta fold hydrolase [Kitasatospora purpeofusca]|uniref:alpha/beta fold hydrolase n=1 Tax=Kitasatospora purpeofusca TaxID=67352 RepID=UPI00224E2386|nr:alpha/beta hydrolase [Kitasatospora purpeofusca]MCX4755254.1 alpha/beta hydrolase [Kitasatospora purpeofusca]WSR36867.1 alpha/beta hydrolase [Kitasatospora purpeofusca]WSR45148.1 alpha/beta hydrolase [Kitasatospora purpeofusca]